MPAKKKQPTLDITVNTKSMFGGFGDMSYISTDGDKDRSDPYIKQEPIPSRYLGSNMKVGRTPSGRTPDCFLGKEFLSLASAGQTKGGAPDPYVDPGKADIAAAKEAKKKNIDTKDFKYSSVPSQPLGSGSDFGCFSKHLEHKPEYKVVERGSVADPEKRPKPQPKNIITRPGKKGTFGYPNTTIGKPFEAPQKADEYEAHRRLDHERWEESKKKRIGTGVFRTAIPARGTFDEKVSGVSKVYDFVEMKPMKEKKEKPAKEGEEKKETKAWKSAGASQGYLNPFPNKREGDKPDPYDTLRLKRKEEREKGPKPLAGSWKPVSGNKSGVVRSLLKRFY